VFGIALCLVLGLSLWLLAKSIRFLHAIVARIAAFWSRPAGLAS
jgi:hypothetical protein